MIYYTRQQVIEWLTDISLCPPDYANDDFDATATEDMANTALDMLKPHRGNMAALLEPEDTTGSKEGLIFGQSDISGFSNVNDDEQFCRSATGYEVEYCNVCEHEIELKWDINQDGFQAYCPVCGSRLMLCDACIHRYGDALNDCDYGMYMDKELCRFRRPESWWKENVNDG